jgi:2-hydroxy-3-keto-5-methylthiopentenyl-1-phosphate phosphatase
MEIDDVLFHTYIYDENFGFMADPAPRDPEHYLKFGDKEIPIKVYMRDNWEKFIEFLKENKNEIEPIVYTSGIPEYTNMLMDIIDPKKEVF